MNRAFLIILIPTALVIVGYVVVLRRLGITLPWFELAVPIGVLLAAAVWWALRKREAK